MGLTTNTIAEAIRRKGWSVSDLATFWGVSRQHVYELMRREQPGALIDCAIRGLPKLTPGMQRQLRDQRRQTAKPRTSRRSPPAVGYEAGDGVTCTEVFECMKENEEAWILEVRGTKKAATLLIAFGEQVWSMPLPVFERHFAPNGKIRRQFHR